MLQFEYSASDIFDIQNFISFNFSYFFFWGGGRGGRAGGEGGKPYKSNQLGGETVKYELAGG